MIIVNYFKTLASAGKKMFYPAADRNKSFILETLQKHLDSKNEGKLLEISSGTGQHISYFAEHFPNIKFQPSEYDTSLFDSIKTYAKQTSTKNVLFPIKIDVTADSKTWNIENNFDYVLNINMIHITPFDCTIGLFKNCSAILKTGGLLITYGPYANNGVLEPQSNINFDKGLRIQNSEWGVRDIQDLKKVAIANNIELIALYDLPANNKCLVWKKL